LEIDIIITISVVNCNIGDSNSHFENLNHEEHEEKIKYPDISRQFFNFWQPYFQMKNPWLHPGKVRYAWSRIFLNSLKPCLSVPGCLKKAKE